jgi:mannose-6-phosphate isomerase-like protein (cupin superfamily)
VSNIIKKLYAQPPLRGDGELIWEVVTHRDGLPIGIATVDIESTQLHRHERTHEWYVVLEGEALIILGDDEVRVGKDTLIYIKPRTPHRARKMGEGKLRILVITYPAWTEEDHHEID